LVDFARRQAGGRALQAHYGIGWLCAAIMWAEIGDARRFHSSDQLVRGIPSIIMSPDQYPSTQIRLGAGTRNVASHIQLMRGSR
jgi:Transposase IS116/IS110/IS902 family